MESKSLADVVLPADQRVTVRQANIAFAIRGELLEPQQVDECWRRWTDTRDEVAREKLICAHLPYARTMAALLYRARTHDEIEFEEYFQWASVGLLEALDRYDPNRGAQFKTYATRRIQGAILNGLERLTEKQQQIAMRKRLQIERRDSAKQVTDEDPLVGTSAIQMPLLQRLAEVGVGLALCYLLDDTGMVANDERAIASSAYYSHTEVEQLRLRLRLLINDLSVQEQTVIKYHYLQERPFDEIASTLALTKGRISQIHRRALDKLRLSIRNTRPCDVAW
jgi:RNA polymerase sigma factor FliA